MTAKDRNLVVRRNNYCVNCLAKSHTVSACDSMATCRKCDRYHHTLLHPEHPRVRGPAQSRLTPAQQQPRKRKMAKQASSQKSQRRRKTVNQPQIITPDQSIISEAIKSLASVLCASTAAATSKPRR